MRTRHRLCHTIARLRGAATGALAAVALAGCVEGTGLGLNLVPEEQVQQMGVEAWQALRSEAPASDNATYRRQAEEISGNLLRAAGLNPSEWEVVVFADEQVNAFALPGKKIGVYEGMFEVAETPAQLAAVIGHEIGHVEAAHGAERVNTEIATQLGTQVVAAGLGAANLGPPEQIAKLLGAGAQYGLSLPYSRNQELEADRLGLAYMARAGYDPRAAIELWQRMEKAGGERPPTFMSTHPAPQQRIEALRKLMPEALQSYRAK